MCQKWLIVTSKWLVISWMFWMNLVSNVCGWSTTSHVLISNHDKMTKSPKICFSDCRFSSNMGDRRSLFDARSIILGIWDIVLGFNFIPFIPHRLVFYQARHASQKKNIFIVWHKLPRLPGYFVCLVCFSIPCCSKSRICLVQMVVA